MAEEVRGAKTAAVLAYLNNHSEAGPTAVVKALAEKGIVVTPALVSNLKNRNSKSGKTGKAKTAKRGRKTAALATSDGYNLTVNQLAQVGRYVKEFGGVDKLQNAAAEYERFQAENAS